MTLRRLAGNFYLNGDILYKRNFDMVLLRCMDRHKAGLLMTEVHEGSFGTHSNGHAMAKKMLRADAPVCFAWVSYIRPHFNRGNPFSLVYGMEEVLPVEVEIPSLRMLMEAKLIEAEWCQTRFDQLNLIEEKRLSAMCHGQLYQQRMKKAFDKKVKPRMFREGDLVLKKILSFKLDSRGKWTPNYEGLYVVKRAFSGGALILTTMDGKEFTHPVNADAVKKYFA
ncbi:hypothetical protein KIW84_055126 [Lathyrus oleraceus]|uniref:Uncharacterized protein n=1 Tax=Pisum sativum TaxID=3888 RepID=A0A9D4WX85_PEA|nr:hypothetical protein KIW84_055126 [Pisum sativum]